MRSIIASTVVSLAAVVGTSAQPRPLALTDNLPQPIKFVDARLDAAVTTIARVAGLRIEFAPSVSETDRARPTGHVTVVRTSVGEALTFLTEQAGLTYSLVDATTVRIARK